MRVTLHLISFTEAFMILLSILNQTNSQDPDMTLNCHRMPYAHKVTQTDSKGRTCWDTIYVMSCWGRCDSNEISDWRFPYKMSSHPVCMHGVRQPKIVRLRNCDDGIDPGTDIYEFLEALTCSCSVCKSSEANCQGLGYIGQRTDFLFENL